MRDFLIK